MPFFSIIIPTFNSGKTLAKAIESILSQSFTDLEIIVADGLSKDNTVFILEQYSKKDPRVKYVSEKDNGIYDAMNKGVLRASGTWVYFLGSDDLLFEERVLEKAAKALASSNCDFFYGNAMMMPSKKLYDGPFDFTKLLDRNVCHQAIFYHKKVFGLVGNYNVSYRLHADWDFNLRCFAHPAIRHHFEDLTIGVFTAGGVSASHDIPFLREVLLPLRLQYSHLHPPMKSIREFDKWWRLIRNAQITRLGPDVINDQYPGLPSCLRAVIMIQQQVPAGFLEKGVFSKSLMAVTYLFNRLSKG